MRALKLTAPLALLAAAACAPQLQSEVTRFHTPAVAEARGSFVIRPADEKREGSLEFQTYASDVARALEAQGFRAAAPGERSDYVVTMDFGIGAGQQVIESRPGLGGFYGPGFWGPGFWGPGFGYGRFGFYDPFWGPGFGWGNDIYSYTKYPARLRVEMRRADGSVIFEGRAVADTRSRDLTRIVPLLTRSLFTDFPGRNGQTLIVSIDDQGRATTRMARR
ncbi:MAG: DUF4136 domain-containing protein [Sphingomonadaceae bacterium]|nr:DUF4136 domain-containing protein [Sphingomonadaceae bacterium]